MHDRLRQLRARVRTHQAGRAARAIRYPEARRREIVALLDDARESRGAVASLARALGVPARTLGLWRRRARRRSFRRVMVAGPPPPAAPAATTPVRARVRHIEEIHDADVLRQVAVLLERENARLHERLQTLTAELAQLRGQDATTAQAQLAFLRELLAQRERALFGDASEKRPRSDSFSTV